MKGELHKSTANHYMIKFGNGIHSTVKCYFSYSKHQCVTMLLLGAMCSQKECVCLTYHTEPLDYIWLIKKKPLHINLFFCRV